MPPTLPLVFSVALFLGLLIAAVILLFVGAPFWVWIITLTLAYISTFGIVIALVEISRRRGK